MVETRAEDQLRQMAPRAYRRRAGVLHRRRPAGRVPAQQELRRRDRLRRRRRARRGRLRHRQGRRPANRPTPASFRQDAERLVLGKARQLYADRGQPAARPAAAKSPLPGPPPRIFPVVVIRRPVPGQPADHPLHQRAAHRRRATAGRHRAAAHRHGPGRAGRLPGPPASASRTLPQLLDALAGSHPTATRLSVTTSPTSTAARNSAGQPTCRTPWQNHSKSSSGCSAPPAPGHDRSRQGSSRPPLHGAARHPGRVPVPGRHDPVRARPRRAPIRRPGAPGPAMAALAPACPASHGARPGGRSR